MTNQMRLNYGHLLIIKYVVSWLTGQCPIKIMSHNLWLIRFSTKVKFQKCSINGRCKESWIIICNENSYNGLDGRTSKIWFYSQRLGFRKKSLMYRYQTHPDSKVGRILDAPVNVPEPGLRGLSEFCYSSDMMRNMAIKFENGFLTAKKAMSSNQALLGRSTASTDSTSKLSIEDREDNESLRHQFNLIKSATEKDRLTRDVNRTTVPLK